jgi:dynein heavy chain
LKAATDSKKEAEAKLDAVTKKVAALEAALKEAVEKMASLEEQVARATVQLSNADKLIGGLGGEAKSWEEQVAQLSLQLENVMGDVLVCAGTISYLGPFTADYRSRIVGEWLGEMEAKGLRFTPDCTLSNILADPVKVRQWNIDGLPADAFSIENGIIMSVTKRWPLMIDPQGQANRFIKQSKAKAQLKTIKASDATKKIQQTLETGIRVGQPVLLENVLDTLDPFLEPVLANQTYKDASGSLVIKLGETVIPFHQDFNFQLTTVIPNPHYAPEVSVKVTLLNFAITQSGLEDQLLVQTVETERPDLAEKKNQLVLQNAENQRKLTELQDEILYLLSNSEGNILDDTNLIETLAVSKTTSETIMAAVAEAQIAETEIDGTRAKYVPVAVRGAILFFCISDLSLVDAMYQYSLTWFKALFLMATNAAEKSDNLDQRILNIINQSTYATYTNVCRSIFEIHKLMFSFTLCIKILMGTNEIDLGQWRFLLAGGQLASGRAKPEAAWLSDSAWVEIINLNALPKFSGIDAHIATNLGAWRQLYGSPTPQEDELPGPWNSSLNQFDTLLVLRALRPDKCIPAVQMFVEAKLGRRFIEPPPFDLNAAFQDSTVQMPLIFVLSTGSDPVKGLMAYADSAGMSSKLDYISLGQGQGPKAEKLIKAGKEQGRWVLLMNCHLFISWLTTLEKEVEDIDPQKTDSSFRLWLTSMPSPKFPVSVLQNGVKMTNEPPKGLRANMLATIQAMPSERFDASNKPEVWRKVMFGLLLFNAVILERKKFGPLGWNIQYQFTDGDTDATLRQAELLVNDYEEVPYKVIAALTADVNYGGRVTDTWDRRTMSNVLTSFANARVLEPGYAFSPSGIYRSVDAADADGFIEYLTGLPVNASPEVFGLHDNADITCAQNDTASMFRTILSLQPRASSGGGKSREEVLTETAMDILDKVPPPFNLEAVADRFPTSYEESMNTVVQQECIRYNKMLRVLLGSLKDVIKALKGEVVMTKELEAMGSSLFNNEVPQMWSKEAYPSLKPLGTWVPDLLSRLSFIQAWIDSGKPPAFWISGFFFPQAFITGTMQNHARKYQLPIDTVSFGFKLQPQHFELVSCPLITAPPTDGAYIYGLFLEGARWDGDAGLLKESAAKVLFTQLPVIHMLPEQHRKPPTEGVYYCPIYKTLARFGTLSTTGHSTNFVMTIEVPCCAEQPQIHWVKRGVAGLLSLNF